MSICLFKWPPVRKGIREHVCTFCTEARDLWIRQGCVGKEPKVYNAVQAHNMKNHIERVHKPQAGSSSSHPVQGRGGQTQRNKMVSSELSAPPSTLTIPDLEQGLTTSQNRGRGRGPWSSGRAAPYPAEGIRNDRVHRELSGHRKSVSHSMRTASFLTPFHTPIGTRARSATPQRLKYEGYAPTQPFYTPQGSYPTLDWEMSPNTYDTLGAADAKQHPILSLRDAGGFANFEPYSDPAEPILGTSSDGYSSGLSSTGWPTPSPSGQDMIHDDLAYFQKQDSLDDYSVGQNPRIAFSTYMPNGEPYYGLSISQSEPQYAGDSFVATENTLGLEISATHSLDALSGVFENGDPQYSSYVKSPFYADVPNSLAPNFSAIYTPGLVAEMPAPPPCYITNSIHQNVSANGNVGTGGNLFPRHVFGSQYSHINIPEIDTTSPYDLEPLVFEKGQE
ncbi:hypothetical protein HYPSUDRAFT_41113 [Hypholoma sublateritium FD-334 SS-4]|uniref:Uncharacterized protein n=1 Tax=Hypholoma sublateritium (strain FD-334 SS-4) TaxID=945553 RepID=A0A0D2P0K0_HYPSF|nr:hypothetical protein HYPSUDRAFT_41113 [Hypholoma sublateritium FD-334 SS-4]